MVDEEILRQEIIDERFNFGVYLILNWESETFRIYFGDEDDLRTHIFLGPFQNQKHADVAFVETVNYLTELNDKLSQV